VNQEYNNQDKAKLKYLLLAESIITQIKNGELGIGDQIPSVNQLSSGYGMSKSTVLMGLNHLSEKGIIEAVYRKGYFVRKNSVDHDYRIFFLMDKITVFKEELYQAFYNQLKEKADIDVYFHNHNYRIFERLVLENLHNYTHFVVISILKEDVSGIINQIPPEKRIILDYNEEGLNGNYSVVYQDFEGDLYSALRDVRTRIEKYKRLVLVLPDNTFYGHLVKQGFQKYCNEFCQPHSIINKVTEDNFCVGDVYITLNRYDIDDVNIIKLVHKRKLQLGVDVGLISYNDLYMKEVLEGGITVISADFTRMGEEAANLIKENRIAKIKSPSKLIIRASL
jgi:DNA-binding GntR family transcriptional regulator